MHAADRALAEKKVIQFAMRYIPTSPPLPCYSPRNLRFRFMLPRCTIFFPLTENDRALAGCVVQVQAIEPGELSDHGGRVATRHVSSLYLVLTSDPNQESVSPGLAEHTANPTHVCDSVGEEHQMHLAGEFHVVLFQVLEK